MLFVCAILMVFVSNSIQWPSSTLPNYQNPAFYRGLVTSSNRRYFMHMPNFVVHRSRPEILPSIASINGLYPYYYNPNVKNTIPTFASITPTAMFPSIDDESFGGNEKVDTEIVDVEDFADTNEKPTEKEQTNDNDAQEVEIDEMANGDNELPNDSDLDRNRFYQYYYLRGQQPQFATETGPYKNTIYMMMNSGKDIEPVKLMRIKQQQSNNGQRKLAKKSSTENVNKH